MDINAAVKRDFISTDLAKSDKLIAFAAEKQLAVYGNSGATGLRAVLDKVSKPIKWSSAPSYPTSILFRSPRAVRPKSPTEIYKNSIALDS